MANSSGPPDAARGAERPWVRRRRAVHELRGELISLVGLLGRPILDAAGTRVGRVDDVVIRWSERDVHPPVHGIASRLGKALALIGIETVDVTQTTVRLRTTRVLVDEAARRPEHVALARDVLDHQLVDVGNVQVVRAGDVYLVATSDGLRVAGVDVSLRAFMRRALPGRRGFRPPGRLVDWAELQAFAARPVDDAGEPESADTDRTRAAGIVGGTMRLGVPASQLRTMSSVDLAAVLHQLSRDASTQVVTLAEPVTAAAALSSLRPDARAALLAQLDPADRARLEALIANGNDR